MKPGIITQLALSSELTTWEAWGNDYDPALVRYVVEAVPNLYPQIIEHLFNRLADSEKTLHVLVITDRTQIAVEQRPLSVVLQEARKRPGAVHVIAYQGSSLSEVSSSNVLAQWNDETLYAFLPDGAEVCHGPANLDTDGYYFLMRDELKARFISELHSLQEELEFTFEVGH